MKENLKELRRVLGQTQAEFAATIGVSKDAVASWETGRNRLSDWMARRIALATGVDERSLQGSGPLATRDRFPRRPFTKEEFQAHQRSFWGASAEARVRRQVGRCADALELLFTAAARAEEGSGAARLTGVLDAFSQWCERTRKDFELGREIDAQLAERKWVQPLTKTYGQWRAMAKEQPELVRQCGFRDDPKRSDTETLRLNLELVPTWRPGQEMRKKKSDSSPRSERGDKT